MSARSFVPLVVVLSACLAGCGGSSSQGTPSPDPPAKQTYSLTVALSGSGSVSSAPAGLDCGATCSASFAQGTSVTLTAMAASGTNFSGWGGACSGSKTACTLSITAVMNVTATFAAQVAANTCTQVSQYGVTFSFDQAYPCGTFANGDYWVTPASAGGHVNVTAITPVFTGTQNGFQINPTDVVNQGFDSEAAHFDATLVPTLPHAASAGESIVKAISLPANSTTGVRLKTAAVLTVLGSIPPDNGATVFRPP